MFFSLPQPIMTNSDLGRLLKAFEIQSVLRAPMYVEIFDLMIKIQISQ